LPGRAFLSYFAMDGLFTAPDLLGIVVEHVSFESLYVLPRVSKAAKNALDWAALRKGRAKRFKDGVRYVAWGNGWMNFVDIIKVKRKRPSSTFVQLGHSPRYYKVRMARNGIECFKVDPHLRGRSRVVTATDRFDNSMRNAVAKENTYWLATL
jgi:hypothetical protein